MFMETETLSNKEKTKRVNFIRFIIKKRANKAIADNYKTIQGA